MTLAPLRLIRVRAVRQYPKTSLCCPISLIAIIRDLGCVPNDYNYSPAQGLSESSAFLFVDKMTTMLGDPKNQ
jgi:hypothetical protein